MKTLLTQQVSEENLQQLQEYHDLPKKTNGHDYNKYILENPSEYMVTITVIDVPPSDISSNIQLLVETVLHCKCVETT